MSPARLGGQDLAQRAVTQAARGLGRAGGGGRRRGRLGWAAKKPKRKAVV